VDLPITDRQDISTPVITITEDHSVPVDDDDFVHYYNLESHIEGILRVQLWWSCISNTVYKPASLFSPLVNPVLAKFTYQAPLDHFSNALS